LNGKFELPNQLRSISHKLANISNSTDATWGVPSALSSPPMSTVAADSPKDPNDTNLTLGFFLNEPCAFSIPEHANRSLITLLHYDLPSLEISEPTSGEWKVVQPCPGLHVCYVRKRFLVASSSRLRQLHFRSSIRKRSGH
jgi:hypothetical protein